MGSTANAAEVAEWNGLTGCNQTEEVCLRNDLYSVTFTCEGDDSAIAGAKSVDQTDSSRLMFYILEFEGEDQDGDAALLCSLTFDSDSIDTLEQKCAVDDKVLWVELALEEEEASECSLAP
jgi:hypothetical protein